VEVAVEGFQTEVRKGIGLTLGQEAQINFDLKVGQVAERVEVTGEAPVVETTNSSITGLVDQNTIRDLPLNGRSFSDLVGLQVGTVLARQDQRGDGVAKLEKQIGITTWPSLHRLSKASARLPCDPGLE